MVSTKVGDGRPSEARSDYLSILSGTSQNVIGIVVAGVATFAAQLLMTHALGKASYGIVTVATQAAFVISFATRAGMDMAVLRTVAVEVGQSRWGQIRTTVARAITIATAVSCGVAVLAILLSEPVRRMFSIDPQLGRWVVPAAAIGLPFLALANVWLAATRGLKIMRYTLYVFWAGQPTLWVVLMVTGWRLSETAWMAALAYSASWAIAAVAAWWFWRKESVKWDAETLEEGALARLVRYAGPRAPAALFSQLLFWTDLFVLTRFATDAQVGVYSAALRTGQVVVLFLTSVNLMFSPFVADLHNRGEIARLDKLFKTVTRWTLVATLPMFLALFVVPGAFLRLFGSGFSGGETALLILLAGQLVNISTGSAGFVLIMTGRTGWDLLVYAISLVLDLSLAFWLCPRYGIEGAAIANAITFAISNVIRLILVKRFVGIQPYDRHYGRLLAPAAAALALMLLVHRALSAGWAIDLVTTVACGLAAYGATYLAVGLTPEERRGAGALLARVKAR